MNTEGIQFTRSQGQWQARLADGRKIQLVSAYLGTSKTALAWTAKRAGLVATGTTRLEAVQSWIFMDNEERTARQARREAQR